MIVHTQMLRMELAQKLIEIWFVDLQRWTLHNQIAQRWNVIPTSENIIKRRKGKHWRWTPFSNLKQILTPLLIWVDVSTYKSNVRRARSSKQISTAPACLGSSLYIHRRWSGSKDQLHCKTRWCFSFVMWFNMLINTRGHECSYFW